MSNFSLTSLPLTALESLHLGTLSLEEVKKLRQHAWGNKFELECDDWMHSKGLAPIARRWRSLMSKCDRELETRFEMET